MPTAARVTLKHIATRVGVSHSAVSLALNDRPGVSEALRRRIKEAAGELGYRPDPALSALVAYRAGIRQSTEFAVIGFLSGWNRADPSKSTVVRCTTLDAARERVLHHGYELREFWVSNDPVQHRQLGRMLVAQGIRGLLIAATPQNNPPPALPWEEFSTVVLGRSNAPPELDRCSANTYQDVRLCVRMLLLRGARRIGLATSDYFLRWIGHEPVGAIERAWWIEGGGFSRIPTLTWTTNEEAAVRMPQWIREHRVDAVLTHYPDITLQAARTLGMAVPNDLQFVDLAKKPHDTVAGVLQPDAHVAKYAVDLLAEKIRHVQRGFPEVRRNVMVDGLWSPGWTVRDPAPSSPAGTDSPRESGEPERLADMSEGRVRATSIV